MRQGDIILRKVDSLPEGLKKSTNLTLAYGEVSGHHHTLIPKDKESKVITYRGIDSLYFQVEGKAVLMHSAFKEVDTEKLDSYVKEINRKITKGEDFHRPQVVTAGIYKVEPEKEYNPFIKELTISRD